MGSRDRFLNFSPTIPVDFIAAGEKSNEALIKAHFLEVEEERVGHFSSRNIAKWVSSVMILTESCC